MRARLDVDGVVHEVALRQEGGQWLVEVDGVLVAVRPLGDGAWDVQGRRVTVDLDRMAVDGSTLAVKVLAWTGSDRAGAGKGGDLPVKAPMTGRLERVAVNAGQAVQRGDVLFVLEAMKMQNEVRAPRAGTVKAIHARAGAALEPSTVVLELAPP